MNAVSDGSNKTVAITQYKRGSLSREAILDKASQLFRTQGYQNTSMDDVALALNVTKPTLYSRFECKEALLLESVELAYSEFQSAVDKVDFSDMNARQMLEKFLWLYLNVVVSDYGISLVLSDSRVLSEAGRARFWQMRRSMNREVQKFLVLGLKDGSLDVPDPSLASYAIFGMFNWVSRWVDGKPELTKEEIFDTFSHILLNGIGGASGTKP